MPQVKMQGSASYSKHAPFFWVEPSPTSTIKVTKRRRQRGAGTGVGAGGRKLTLKERHKIRDKRVDDFMRTKEFPVLAPKEAVHASEIVTPGFDSFYSDDAAPVGTSVKTSSGVIVTRGDVSEVDGNGMVM